MQGLDSLAAVSGRWKGTYRLWEPGALAQRSQSAMRVVAVIGGRLIRMDYTWSYGAEAQEGSLLIGWEAKKRLITAVWVDSWHMGDKSMMCKGAADRNGVIVVRGSYAVRGSRNWGWRTLIKPSPGRSIRMSMYNVSPGGKEELAVKATFAKSARLGHQAAEQDAAPDERRMAGRGGARS
jgi:hypothetical protein